MTKSEDLFHKIAGELADVKEGKMFGALCIKATNGKASVMFWHDDIIFKLQGDDLEAHLVHRLGARWRSCSPRTPSSRPSFRIPPAI